MYYSKEAQEKWGNTEVYAEYTAKSYSKVHMRVPGRKNVVSLPVLL